MNSSKTNLKCQELTYLIEVAKPFFYNQNFIPYAGYMYNNSI